MGAVIPPETGAQVTDGVIDQGERPTDALFLRFLSRHGSALKKTARSYFQRMKPFPLIERQRWKGQQRRIGLTGGIASGKSSVGHFLEQQGIAVLDADLYAHQALAPGTPATRAVLERYGAKVQSEFYEGLDRAALGAIVFSDPQERTWLEAQLHPLVRQRFDQELETHVGESVVALMIPLLFETGLESLCSEVWVVYCSPTQQRQRLLTRNQLSLEEAEHRIRAQWPIDRKIELADSVIKNGGFPQSWTSQVRELLYETPPLE
jgi:dephospho-CoA kinase